jgi:hypothetical protein
MVDFFDGFILDVKKPHCLVSRGVLRVDLKRGSDPNGTDLSAIACQILPFALSLSKGNEGFDKLSPNGNLLKSVPLEPGPF